MKLLFSKLKNGLFLSHRQRKLILMVFWLSIYRYLLLAVKSKKAYTEEISKNQLAHVLLTFEKIALAKDLAMAIHIVNKHILWKNVCRHQSWQAVYLLLRYEIPFEYYVGIEKNKSKKEGHSWVKVNGQFVCGRCKENQYILIVQ